MAIKKIQIKPPDDNYGDVLHPETDSTQVLMGDNNTLEQFKTDTNTALAGKVPTSRTINSKALTGDIALTATDVGAAVTQVYSSTLNTTWSGSAAPFSKAQTVAGILATDTPIIDVVMSGTYATDEKRAEAWGNIYRAVASANTITFYATEKPTVELPLQIKVVR